MRKIIAVWLAMLILMGGMMSGAARYNHCSKQYEVNDGVCTNYYENVENYPATYDKNTNNIINPGWYKTWGGTDYDISCDVVVNDGFVYIIGYTYGYGTDNGDGVCLLKYNTNGNLIWNRSWGGTSHDCGFSISVDAGYIYVTGDTYLSGAEEEVCLLKYDTDGNLIWNRTWGGAKQDEGYSVIVDTVGYIYVIGRTENYGAGDYDVFLLKYDANGNLIWNKTWGGTNYERGYSATIESEYIYITGTTKSYGAGCKDIFLLKYDTNGNQIWNKTWGGTNQDEGYSVGVDAEYIYITGYTYSYGAGSYDVCLLKYDTDGNLVWDKTWGGSSYDFGFSVAVDAGYIYITGYTYSYGAGDYDVCLLKYDTTGNLTWYKTWGGVSYDEGLGIFVDSTGYIYITGYTDSYTVYSCDMFLLKCDLNGGCGGYAPHDTIYIYSNSDFTSANGVTGGNGTEDDPYIIEGWDINASWAHGIEIRNVDKYFIIRNCYIHDGKNNWNYGIFFYSVQNGKIDNVTLYNNNRGIKLRDSTNNHIVGCAIYNNTGPGILLEFSSNNNITNCVLHNNSCGIDGGDSPNTIISNCTLYNNSWKGINMYDASGNTISQCIVYDNYYGICIDSSSKSKITNCVIYNNSWRGIRLRSVSGNNDITNCDVYNSYYGIELYNSYYSPNIIVSNCTIHNNSAHGIELSSFSHTTVSNCDVYGNPYGIDVSSSTHITILNCSFYDNSYGIDLSSADNNQIISSAFYNNFYGIYMYSSTNNNITNCVVYNNSRGGISLGSSSNNTLIGNIFTNDGVGIYGSNLQHYIHNIDISNTVNCKPLYYFKNQNNVVVDSIAVGQLILANCTNSDINNITITNTAVGIELAYSSNNNIINCSVYNNSCFGIYLYYSLNNQITNCYVYNNYREGILLSSSSNNTITNCAIYNSRPGIKLGSSSNNEIHYNNIYNNTDYGIYNPNIATQYQVNATYNWWGSADGPHHLTTNPSGTGNAVTDNVLYNPWLSTPVEMNQPPVADFTYSPTSPTIADTIQFIDKSIDSDGTIESWLWNFGDGNTSTVKNPTKQYTIAGTYTVTLTVTDDDGASDSYIKEISVNPAGLVSHAPIYINGNANFTSANGVTSGSGTQADPYIIENWDINASSAHGIHIENTDVYFIIRKCEIHDGKSNWKEGIYFSSVQNCKIDNVTSYDNSYGIILNSSSNNVITNCTAYNNDFGITLCSSSNNNQISNCTIYNNSYYGIELQSSSNNTISNCMIHNHFYYGIYLRNSSNNQITNCVIHDNYDGIYIIHQSSNNNITNCVIYNNSYGIPLANSAYNNIMYCSIYENYAAGICLLSSSNNTITNCNVYNNSEWGIMLEASSNNEIHYCNIYNNYWGGIKLTSSCNNLVSICNVYDNGGEHRTSWGILLTEHSSNNTVSKCVVYNNYYRGISLECSSNNNINNCNSYNTGYGIQLSNSSNSNITNCTLYNNSVGIDIWFSSNGNTITNCDFYNNDDGIYLYYSSSNNQITYCNITGNPYYGFYISYDADHPSTYNIFHHNNFINNGQNAYDLHTNFWDNGIEGNYWSDYTDEDNDGDGIGDTPYNISGGSNQDHYPLMHPSGWAEVSELTPHEPIYISDNDDFTLENGVVSGSGTESDPYIIEGYDINAGTARYPGYAGVHIENTDAYFIIRNYVIHDGYEEEVMYNYGIYFYNVTNGKIENVTSYNNCYGVNLYYSSNNTITNCTVYNNSWYGIELYESANSTVANCTIYNNSYGISLSRSLNCKVENCTVYNHTWCGISVSSQSSNNRIVNCVVYNNSYYGIQISSSAWNVVINCSIYNNSRYGIYSSYSQYNQIANSILYNNTDYNIYLRSSLYDQVTNCVLYNSNYGAYLYSCLYDKIADCTFYNNRYHGIYFTSSLYNQIANNKIINCSTGVCFYFSFSNQITNCTLNNNSYSGGSFQFSSNNTVTRCNLSANNQGFYLYSSSNNNCIYHNSFINNANNAYDECTNYWDYNGEGNYWGNYTGTDNNGDCIGDIPYSISGGNNKDNCPLMHEFKWWDTKMPVISLLSPGNNSVINPNTVLEFDIIDDNLWKARYSVNNGVVHYFSSPYNISTNGWKDGTYNITIYAKDWGMNEISKIFIFTVDGTPPAAIITDENQIINSTSFTMHWGTNATDIQFYEISTDGSHWVNVETNTSYTFINLVEGFNTLYVRGIDIVNNAGISSSIIIVVEIPISEDIIQEKEEINWLLYASIIVAVFIVLMLAGIGITGARRVERCKVLYPQKLKCIYCQETAKVTSSDRPLLFQCQKCGGKSVIR